MTIVVGAGIEVGPGVLIGSGSVPENNPILYLDAEDYSGSGTTWTADTGSDGTLVNAPTYTIPSPTYFSFNGTNDTVSIPHASSLSLVTGSQRTIQVWVKFDALGGLDQQIPVLGKLSSSFSFDGYWAGLFSNAGVVRCVTNGTGVQRISNSGLTVTTNTWYLFTFISQITSASGSTKVYINGTEYISAAHGTDGYSESNPLYLGFIGSGVGSLYLNGKIGACYFYTAGLTQEQVEANYDATKTRFGL